MAQHFDVTNQVPEQVKKSLARIIEYISRRYVIIMFRNTGSHSVYRKNVTFLPQTYAADFSGSESAATVGPYNLALPEFFKGKQDCKFEVHYTNGQITKIYFPY